MKYLLIVALMSLFCLLSFEPAFVQEKKQTQEEYEAMKKKIEAENAAKMKNKQAADVINSAKKSYNDGSQFLRQGKHQKALASYDDAVKVKTEYSSKAYHGRGIALKKLRRYGEAEASYKKAIEIDSSNVKAYFALGKLYSTQDKNKEALAIYDLAVKRNANWEKPYYEKAVIYKKLKEYNKAAAALRMATQLKPDYYKAYYLLGRVLLSDAKYDGAISAFETTAALKSKYYQAHWGIAKANNKKGDHKAALEAAQAAIKMKPNDAMSNIEAGDACKALGRKQDAISYYKKAAKNRKWRKTAEYEIKMLTVQK